MLVVKTITFPNEQDFWKLLLGRLRTAASDMAEQLGKEIVSDLQGKQWNTLPDMKAEWPESEGYQAVVDLVTNDKRYGWISDGTEPVNIYKPFASSRGGMRFRFQGVGQSYASKTDGKSGGDYRGQIGPIVRRERVSSRRIAARKITDRVIAARIDAILAVGEKAFR